MRRILLMIRMLTVLCAVCLTVLLNWQSKDDALAGIALQPMESTVMVPLQQHHHEATLTDASQIYRVCSSRPQRILPSQGSKTGRTITPFGNPHKVLGQKEPSRRLATLPYGNILSNTFIPVTTAGAARRRLHSACRPRATTMLSH